MSPSGTPIAMEMPTTISAISQRTARAQDHAGENVAPEVVGAKGMLPARRLEALEEVRSRDIAGIGRQQRRQNGDCRPR